MKATQSGAKKLFAFFTLMAALCGLSASAFAEQAASAAAPVPNKGDTAWMLVATVLVIMMTLPGLANFCMVGQWATSAGSLFSNALSGRTAFKTLRKQQGRKFTAG